MSHTIYLILQDGKPTALAFTRLDRAQEYISKANDPAFSTGTTYTYSTMNVRLYGSLT